MDVYLDIHAPHVRGNKHEAVSHEVDLTIYSSEVHNNVQFH